uniref:Uncharacterized protein n=1 Tax=Stomoxys calcitrans TaxID=35570 RepID=A0A1I8PFT4_STOCA|nr:unnamed protein product [Stomoxys calcitrans]
MKFLLVTLFGLLATHISAIEVSPDDAVAIAVNKEEKATQLTDVADLGDGHANVADRNARWGYGGWGYGGRGWGGGWGGRWGGGWGGRWGGGWGGGYHGHGYGHWHWHRHPHYHWG